MSKLKDTIKEYLESKNNYQESDEFLINDLEKIKEIAKKCEKAIDNNTHYAGKTFIEDINLLFRCINMTKDAYVHLGITPHVRLKLKLEESKAEQESKLAELKRRKAELENEEK